MRTANWLTVTAARIGAEGHVRPWYGTPVAHVERFDLMGPATQRPDKAFAASQHREDHF